MAINCFAPSRLCAKNTPCKRDFSSAPPAAARRSAAWRKSAPRCAAIAGRPAADSARAQTGHVSTRTPVARPERWGERPREPRHIVGSPGVSPHQLRLHAAAHFFIRAAGAVHPRRARRPDAAGIACRGRPRDGAARAVDAARKRIEIVSPQRAPPRFRAGTQPDCSANCSSINSRRPNSARLPAAPTCAANFGTNSTTSRCCSRLTRTGSPNTNCRTATACWMRRRKVSSPRSKVQSQPANRASRHLPSSIFHLRSNFQPVARWFRRNDAAGTGFARRHFAVLRTRHARVLPRHEPAAETSWLSIWSSVGKTFQQCRQRIENLPDCEISVEILERDPGQKPFPEQSGFAAPGSKLECNVHASERRLQRSDPVACQPPEAGTPSNPIRIIACPNPEAEAVFAAREILKFVHRRAGNRFRDAAVLVRSLDGYHKPLARAFRRYGIPFFLDRRESVAHHPLAELTRSALRTVAFDWPHDDWFAALKAGFSPRGTRPKLTGWKMRRSPAAGAAQNGANPFKSRTIPNLEKFSNGCAKKSCRRLKILPRNWRD